MSDFDLTALVTALTDITTLFLVTIPSVFINSAINGGILWSIFSVIVDTPAIFHVVVILSLVGGVWLWLRSMDSTKIKRAKLR
ncbi:MAG: hypothetical protein ACXAC2_09845 [Candidatus Kariarchaeaceae archaeon]